MIDSEILIVDDEPDLAHLFHTWLSASWDVAVAHNGNDALELISPSTEVVVLDRRMPGLSGDEVLSRIADRGLLCRVVFVSAAEPDENVVDLTFDEYLVKPVTRSELVDVVDQLYHWRPEDEETWSVQRLITKKQLLEGHRQRAIDNNRQAINRVTQQLQEAKGRLGEDREYDQGLSDLTRA